jgi:PAS domain S-box-containing protein
MAKEPDHSYGTGPEKRISPYTGIEEAAERRIRELAEASAALPQEVADSRRMSDSPSAARRGEEAVIDAIPGFVALLSADGRVDFVNRRILEYSGRANPISPIGLLRGPSTRPMFLTWRRSFERSIASGTPFEFDLRLRRFDGAYRWFNFRGVPEHDGASRIVRWFVLFTDIDQRKQAEEALRASEAAYRGVVDNIPAYVAISMRKSGVEFINRQLADYAGLTSEEFARWRTTCAIHPEDVPSTIEALERAYRDGQPFEIEHRMRRFDGVYRWFHSRGRLEADPDGGPPNWYFATTDIDDRKRVEDSLRRSEAFLVEGQWLSQTGSFSWRTDTDAIVFSEQLYRIFEISPSTALTLELIASRVHPLDVPLVQSKIMHARDGGTELDYGVRLQMPDGRA